MSIKKKYAAVLREINASIPQEYFDNLMITQRVSPNVLKVVDLALNDPSISDEKKRKLQNIKDTGMLEQDETVINEATEKAINEHIEKEIERAIKLGKLPKDRKLLTKAKQNVRKQTRRSKEEDDRTSRE